MRKLKDFVHLDFITVKPYFTIKNVLLFAGVALFLTVMSGSIVSASGIGAMLGTLFVSYPFAVGEKCNLDALYVTLSLSRKTVVLGRYLFVLALNLCAVLFSALFSAVGLLAGRLFNFLPAAAESFWPFLALSALFLVLQAIQLPVFFRFGYAKAKFFSAIPFAVLMAGYTTFGLIQKNTNVLLPQWITKLLANSAVTAVVFGLGLCLVVSLSYGLSLASYKKREF
jgi:hypothetical protein